MLTLSNSDINQIRKSIIQITHQTNSAHVGSNLSVVEILACAYLYFTNCNLKSCDVVLSKGHAALSQYVILSKLGLLPDFNMENFCLDGSFFGYSNSKASALIPLSTGSLGHGLPFATGIAYAKQKNNLSCKTIVVMSDGECNEGTTWESALFAAHNKLKNLCVIIDRNKIQSFGSTEEVMNLEPFVDKWTANNWRTSEIDGHDTQQILNAIQENSNRPHCIIAHTIKGKGVSFMENKLLWHYKSPNVNQIEQALKELA